MRLESVEIKDFKRFSDLKIRDIPATAKLIMLTGPNGSGKTSLFEAFNYNMGWVRGENNLDREYHYRVGSPIPANNDMYSNIKLSFHDGNKTNVGKNSQHRKLFYIRSSYRHEPDFTMNGLNRSDDILVDQNRPRQLINQEHRVSDNYQRIVGDSIIALYDDAKNHDTGKVIKEAMIGEIRTSMQAVFGDLILEGPGNPLQGGTFRFKKGMSSGFHYKNLSGGEKAAFDLLLDFIVKRKAFDDTIFCIDEPELHMHTKLQAKLLAQMFTLIPDNCQLWISTHSIGMARKAAELNSTFPGEVCFIDFHDKDFDQPEVLTPVHPGRTFWKNMFSTALDDLAELVVPQKVVFCEGRQAGVAGRKPSFDVSVYSKIFNETFPDTDFLPLGGTTQVQNDGKMAGTVLAKLAPGIQSWMLFDRDDRSPTEISDLKQNGVKVLNRRDLESYLWDGEVLTKLAESKGQPQLAMTLINEKVRLIAGLAAAQKPVDDVKAISGELYNFCKRTLGLTQCGNNAEAFSIDTLAALITVDTAVYAELKDAIF